MSMVQLVAAGAPELPEGWFYRVREGLTLGYKLEIREQRRFFSYLIQDTYVLEDRFDDMTDALVDAPCRRAHRAVEERATLRRKLSELAKYVGDHDPKGGR
jgi:hypothetical protein